MHALLGQDRSANDARGRTARSADALPDASPRRGDPPRGGAQSPGSIDREALVRAMVGTLPRTRARAALRRVRAFLRIVLGAAEVHGLLFAYREQGDRDELFGSMHGALRSAACAMIYDRESDLVLVLVAALLGDTPYSYSVRYGMCDDDDERRDALRGLRIVGRVLRGLRATNGGAS